VHSSISIQYLEAFAPLPAFLLPQLPSQPGSNMEKTNHESHARLTTMTSEKKEDRSSSSGSPPAEIEHLNIKASGHPGQHSAASDEALRERREASQKLANPLAGLGPDQLAAMGEAYARQAGLTSDEDMRAFRLGAMIAGDATEYDGIAELTDREREVLEREMTHKWSNPSMLYWVIISTCMAGHPLLSVAGPT
jgi:hypothetical protein